MIEEGGQLPQSTLHPELSRQVENIVQHLPPIEFSRLASAEIDYYGASNNIARSLGLSDIPYTRASWLHGWCRYPLTQIELLALEDATVCCEPKEVPNLVSSLEQEIFLKQHGYQHSKAVGLPFIYTKEPTVDRIPNSLLIIPEHSVKENNVNYEGSKALSTPYSANELRERFSTVVACIGGFCVQKNNYLDIYENAAIPWVTGAWLHDAFALQRMRNLFCQFEYVATNAMGSHVPYAGFSGCKVSYYGKGHNRPREDYLSTPIYEKYPHLIDIVDEEQKIEVLRERYPFLFSDIENSNQIKEWSNEVLGSKNKIPEQQVAELIGWKIRPKDEMSWEYIPGENPGVDDPSRG
ncbi:hypothetical protein OAK38_00265 [Verrucomicrobia bacterium]|nr:hypothetical protein [Verrucomicrobiota bacterium]